MKFCHHTQIMIDFCCMANRTMDDECEAVTICPKDLTANVTGQNEAPAETVSVVLHRHFF